MFLPLPTLPRLVWLGVALLGLASLAQAQTAKPAFTSRLPKALLAELGDNVTLTVGVTGTPSPALQWRKNKAALAGETATSLALSNVGSSASGTYDVVATNSRGSRTSSATRLTVALAPSSLTIGSTLYANATYRFGRETDSAMGSYQITSAGSFIDLGAPQDPATTFTYRRISPTTATAVFNDTYFDPEIGATVTSTETLRITFTQGADGVRQATFTSSGSLSAVIDGKRRKIAFRGTGTLALVAPNIGGSGNAGRPGPPMPDTDIVGVTVSS